MNDHKAPGLGGTDATQDEDALSPELEEFIHRSGELNEEVIVVDDEKGANQGSDEPIHEDEVPDEGPQQPNLPVQPPPSPEDPMIVNTEPTQPVDTTVGGIDATSDDEDIMIDAEGFYSNNPEDSHREFPIGNVDKGGLTDDSDGRSSPPTAMDINNEQNLEVTDTSSRQKEISSVDASAPTANLVLDLGSFC